jgi:hypothetical protein
MLVIHDTCPFCGQGAIGFLHCIDTLDVILLCDECDSAWLDPATITAQEARFPDPPDFLVPGVQCSLYRTRWATRQEIVQRGWERYIAGEGKALNET